MYNWLRERGKPMKRVWSSVVAVLTAVLLSVPVALPVMTPVAEAIDTVGTYATPNGYNLPNLTEIRWKADIPEYEINTMLLRFEYNMLLFKGPSGGYVGYLAGAIQNLIHQYNEADCFIPMSNILPGLELYFSTLEDWGGPFKGGVELTANPDASPRFRRMFQDIDGLSQIGLNVYSNDAIGTPSISRPVTVEWHVKRGEMVTNPAVQIRKDLTCTWTPLVGDYRKWLVDVTIDGTNYSVATWYLPEAYAQYLNPNDFFEFGQEYFGACNKIGVGYQLPVNKGHVEYYDIRVSSDGMTWTDISSWKLWSSYDGECYKDLNQYTADPSDTRFGMGTIVKNGQKRIITRVGHDNDVNMRKCSVPNSDVCITTPITFSGISAPPSGSEVTISNALAQRQPDSATITWNTSLAADSMVRYGTTPNYGSSQYVADSVSTHTVQLNGLSPNTLYYYRIESIDSTGHIATFDGTISASVPPVADAGGVYSGIVGQPINFNGSGSYDPDGTIVSYAWDFGDGGISAGASPTHSYAAAGTYTVTLTVTDNSGATATASTSATVNPALPDLIVSSISGVPATLAYGAVAPINITINNSGVVPAGQFIFLNYLSTDNVYSAGDYAVGGSILDGLAAGASISPTTGNTIYGSTSVPAGAYYVITCVDLGNSVTESNETNNCMASNTKVTLPSNTGLRNPTANAAETSSAGDNNGYQTNPTYAYGDDTLNAVDTDSGNSTSTSYTNSGKDKHRFYNFDFVIPDGATIRGVEVRLDARADSTSGSPKIYVQLSGDGGATWTTAKSTATLGTTMKSYTLGSATDTWSKTWGVSNFTNTNFRVRLINVASNTSRDFYLDWVAVRVHH